MADDDDIDLFDSYMAKPKRKKAASRKSPLFNVPGMSGQKTQVTEDAWETIMMQEAKGIPFDSATFVEATYFDDGEAVKRGTARYKIKVGYTTVDPDQIHENSTQRSRSLTPRFIVPATRSQCRDNWRRKPGTKRRRNINPFSQHELDINEEMLESMKVLDDRRPPGSTCPVTRAGYLYHLFGSAGTIRHSQIGLVTWRRDGEVWLPTLRVWDTSDQGQYGSLVTYDPATGEDRDGLFMQAGRGKGVVAYGSHRSAAYLAVLGGPEAEARLRYVLTEQTRATEERRKGEDTPVEEPHPEDEPQQPDG